MMRLSDIVSGLSDVALREDIESGSMFAALKKLIPELNSWEMSYPNGNIPVFTVWWDGGGLSFPVVTYRGAYLPPRTFLQTRVEWGMALQLHIFRAQNKARLESILEAYNEEVAAADRAYMEARTALMERYRAEMTATMDNLDSEVQS